MPRGSSDRGRDDRSRDEPKFKYRGRSQEEVSRRAKQSGGAYDSYLPNEVITFKPRDGENCIRLLPWNINPDTQDDLADKWGDHWGIDISIHYNVGPDEQSYLCLDKMKGEPCPVCEARRSGTDEEADALKISSRILCWLIDRNDEKAGPKIWSMPLGLSNDISAASQLKGGRGGGGEDGKVLLIDNPDEGFDVYFDKEGEKIKTKYKRVEVSREATPVHDKEATQDRWLAYISDPPLPELLNYFEAGYIEKVLFGQSSKGSDDEGASSSRRGRRSEPEAEDEPGDARPSRRGRGEREPEPESEEPRGGRRGRDREAQPENEEPNRGRGRRRGVEPDEEQEETSQDHDHEADEAAQSARGGRERYRGKEKEDPPREERRGRRGGREEEGGEDTDRGSERTTGRRRGGEEPSEEDEGGDAEGARGRLARIGRRGRG